ncbi:MAG: 1-acyl-sn-glycerol-3-phosphate acyltransferase [Rhodothermales bacterium]|nr:1-acyl-sn-glycerol-3-phosphate acyltransferase [Rhodothermales bacterium]
MRTIRSIWAWFAICTLIVIWVPIMEVVNLLDRDPAKYRTGRWFRRLGSVMTRVNPVWRVRVSGYRPSDPRLPYMVVGNHQSAADIPVFSRLPWDMKWIGKQSLFKLPLLGRMMHLSRDIPVDRSSRMSRARVLGEASKRLKLRSSVMIMPEGTRTPDGSVGAFNEGAFRLAIKLGVPILPVAVEGTFDALPKDDWRFGDRQEIKLHVFEPIPVEGLGAADAHALQERVRRMIIARVAEWRGVDPAEVDGAPPVVEEA